jgi:hypothetical protein
VVLNEDLLCRGLRQKKTIYFSILESGGYTSRTVLLFVFLVILPLLDFIVFVLVTPSIPSMHASVEIYSYACFQGKSCLYSVSSVHETCFSDAQCGDKHRNVAFEQMYAREISLFDDANMHQCIRSRSRDVKRLKSILRNRQLSDICVMSYHILFVLPRLNLTRRELLHDSAGVAIVCGTLSLTRCG